MSPNKAAVSPRWTSCLTPRALQPNPNDRNDLACPPLQSCEIRLSGRWPSLRVSRTLSRRSIAARSRVFGSACLSVGRPFSGRSQERSSPTPSNRTSRTVGQQLLSEELDLVKKHPPPPPQEIRVLHRLISGAYVASTLKRGGCQRDLFLNRLCSWTLLRSKETVHIIY